MKSKKSALIIGILLMFICINTISAQDYNFRNAKWGMTSAAVKASETNKFISEDQTNLLYDCSLANIKGKIVYIFTMDKKLVRAKYFLSPDYINMSFYFRDYKMFQDLLKEKYGEPENVSIKAIDKPSINEDEWPCTYRQEYYAWKQHGKLTEQILY